MNLDVKIGSGRPRERAPGGRTRRGDVEPEVVFFGKVVSAACQRCGAFSSTDTGHKYCAHVTCPLALKELKRRKRTSTLETVFMTRLAEP